MSAVRTQSCSEELETSLQRAMRRSMTCTSPQYSDREARCHHTLMPELLSPEEHVAYSVFRSESKCRSGNQSHLKDYLGFRLCVTVASWLWRRRCSVQPVITTPHSPERSPPPGAISCRCKAREPPPCASMSFAVAVGLRRDSVQLGQCGERLQSAVVSNPLCHQGTICNDMNKDALRDVVSPSACRSGLCVQHPGDSPCCGVSVTRST